MQLCRAGCEPINRSLRFRFRWGPQVLLLKKSTFPSAGVETSDGVRLRLEGTGVMDGDVVTCTASDVKGRKW